MVSDGLKERMNAKLNPWAEIDRLKAELADTLRQMAGVV
jgi:hypothetical protein